MKKLVAMLVALMATLFTVSALAYTPPPSPAPASWISDNSHVLSAEAHARLDAKLRQINQSSANEIAALILPSLDGENIADVGDTTAKTWGVGKKGLDNGVLVVLAMKDRKSRISTGKGVEGDLPDLKANDILANARPYLRKGDVEGALGFIFDSSASAIANHKAEVAAGKTGSGTSTRPACDVSGGVGAGGNGWVLVLVAGGAIALVWYLAAQAKRRRLAEEAERQAAKQRSEARRRQLEEREAARKRDAERQRQQNLSKPTPVVTVPTVTPRPVAPSVRPTVPRPEPRTPSVVPAASVAAAATLAAAEEQARKSRAEEDRKRRQREQDDEDRRRKQREDDDRRSSYSSPSYSSYDSGGSSGGSGSFGGGDSGGGGSSGDW